MKFTQYIASRYLFSKKSRNVVNIISRVALVGMIVGTMALVIALSVFNGFDVLIKSFFSVFDPELKITAVHGKHFNPDDAIFDEVRKHPDVVHFAQVVEEIAHLRFEDRQYIAKIKGIDDNYLKTSAVDSTIFDGRMVLYDDNHYYTVIGRGVAYNLGAAVNFVRPIFISVPRKGQSLSVIGNHFKQQYLFLGGIYSVGQQEVDDEFALVHIDIARDLLELNNEVTSVELSLKEGSKLKKVQQDLQSKLGENYLVQNRYQQHESYYRVAQSERFFIYLIFAFILIIASFNLAGSLAMQIIDKKKDIHIMLSFGATKNQIGFIFWLEGVLVSLAGAVIGLFLGVLVSLGQLYFGWVKMPGGFAVDFYPVDIRMQSLVVIFLTVIAIGVVISWIPVRFMPKKFFEITQD